MSSTLVVLAVVAPLLAAAGIVIGRATGLLAGRIATVGCGVSTIAAFILLIASAADDTGQVGDVFGIGVDRVSALLLVAVTGTGAVVAGFSRRSVDDELRTGPYFALVSLVVVASTLVVLPGGPIPLAVGWLISGWSLAALIGWQAGWSTATRARRRIASTLAVGDLALLAALVLLATAGATGATSGDPAAIDELASSSIGGIETLDLVALLLVLAGASRSALIPFHRWLIGTLAAPTPVSALVHAGLVSGAGLLLIRMSGTFVQSDVAVIVAFALGVVTVLVAAGASAMRSDIKGELAWSTVAQMSFMVVQCAVGAFSSAAFHIIGHGMYKASLFLGAGDAVSAGLRSSRRPSAKPASPAVRAASIVVVPTALVALGMWWITPEVSDAGQVLIAVFAWLSAASALNGWLERSPFHAPLAVATATAIAAVSVMAYLAGLRLVERFVAPSFADTAPDTIVGPIATGAVVGLAAAAVIGLVYWPGASGIAARDAAQHRINAIATNGVLAALRVSSQPAVTNVPAHEYDASRSAQIRADVARSARVISPLWPLSSFVAVNPVGGLEEKGFDEATDDARRWLRGRTHLSLAEYRSDLAAGLLTEVDLVEAINYRFMELCSRAPLGADDITVNAESIILADLLVGPETAPGLLPRTELERRLGCDSVSSNTIDEVVAKWLTAYVDPPTWSLVHDDESFTEMSRRWAPVESELAPLIGREARAWLATLDRNPAHIIQAAFSTSGIDDADRVSEMRGQLASLAGWSGLAKWRTEWAQPDDPRPVVTPIEIVAVRTMVETAVILSLGAAAHSGAVAASNAVDDGLAARVEAVRQHLGAPDTAEIRSELTTVLQQVSEADRGATWLVASEAHADHALLSKLDRGATNTPDDTPDAQLVFCIDVRSEGLRRHLESEGHDQTIGFAGFFGVPMRVRQVGWDRAEARCPVLVAPGVDAIETPDPDGVGDLARQLRRSATIGGVNRAHGDTKHVVGASFVAAETLGWLFGPIAAARTFLSRPQGTPERAMSTVEFEDSVLVEQRIFMAESVLNTMGLTQGFAPLVALCGHTSATTNNPHATALECGACAGASGEGNARAVAALLNSPDVRAGLIERGIEIPDETWFIAGLHDTVSDHVELLDTEHASDAHQAGIDALRSRLARAARGQVAQRAEVLPGPAAAADARGSDWAQVRPEWGLARNSAFIIGPRSMTQGLDLGGRAFLHSYEAANDPDGKVLETIMTAPLVVGHWISSQYYFSTVDPEVFGAGDKLLHNPIGTLGVMSGDRGDIRVGLPLQSTHIAGERHHQPLRLLAVIEAEPAQIEQIIDANPILRTLTGGSWIRIAARPNANAPWSVRSAGGTWTITPAALRGSPPIADQTDHDGRHAVGATSSQPDTTEIS